MDASPIFRPPRVPLIETLRVLSQPFIWSMVQKRALSRSIHQGRSRFGNTTKVRACGAALVTAQSLRQGANAMRRVNRENGFTLIEILIATAITAIVMIAGTAFIAKFARTS